MQQTRTTPLIPLPLIRHWAIKACLALDGFLIALLMQPQEQPPVDINVAAQMYPQIV